MRKNPLLYTFTQLHSHIFTHSLIITYSVTDLSPIIHVLSQHFQNILYERELHYIDKHTRMQIWSSVKWWRVARRSWLAGFFATCVGFISWVRCSGCSCWSIWYHTLLDSTWCGLQDSLRCSHRDYFFPSVISWPQIVTSYIKIIDWRQSWYSVFFLLMG